MISTHCKRELRPLLDENAPSLLDIDEVCKHAQPRGNKSELTFADLPEDGPRQRRPDIAFARRALRWEPTVRLEDGLMRTISYFRSTPPG